MTYFSQKIPRAITIPHSKRIAIIIIFLYKNILIFKIQSDQNMHQNVPKLHHIFKIFSCSICPRAPSTYMSANKL